MLILLFFINVYKIWYIGKFMEKLVQSIYTLIKVVKQSSDHCGQQTPFTRQYKVQALTNVEKYFIFKNAVPLSQQRGNEFNISSFYVKYVNCKYT